MNEPLHIGDFIDRPEDMGKDWYRPAGSGATWESWPVEVRAEVLGELGHAGINVPDEHRGPFGLMGYRHQGEHPMLFDSSSMVFSPKRRQDSHAVALRRAARVQRDAQIVERYKAGGISMLDLGLEFGLSQAAVWHIINRARTEGQGA